MPVSVLNHFKRGDLGTCKIQELLWEDFTVMAMSKDVFNQYGDVIMKLGDICEELPSYETFTPGFGDIVAAKSLTENWQRGRILSMVNGTYRVAMFDAAFSEKLITQIKPLPKQLENIPECGVRVTVKEYFVDEVYFRKSCLKSGWCFMFEVINCDKRGGTWNLSSVDSGALLCQVAVSRWVPKFEDQGLKCVTLKNGDLVDVLSYGSSNGIYVRPMDDMQDKLWLSVIQQVGAHCFSEDSLNRMPDIGELLACKYSEDNNYYRALVIDYDGEEILVSYVDFGNDEYVTKDKLKPLSQRLKEIPCMAVLVKLKAVHQQPLTKSAVWFLNGLVAGTSLLTVLFKNSYSKDGVELKMEDNKLVSDILNKCLTPNWKIALSEGRNPTDNEFCGDAVDVVESITLPKNKLFKIAVLYVEGAGMFWGCPLEDDISHYVITQLPKELDEYCKSLSTERYMPRINELCIAKCNDQWCRAICLQNAHSRSMLRLIDYGDMVGVDHSCIRKMCADFLWYKSAAVLCCIDGLPVNHTDDLTVRLNDLITVKSNHMVKVVSIEDEYQYHLEMPDIIDRLQSEGLLIKPNTLMNGDSL